MVKYAAIVLVVLLSFSDSSADTFIHRWTGENFNGYATQRRKGNKTQVRIEGKAPRYLDLGDYEIRRNYLGRKNKVFIFSINDSIDLLCETEAFEKAVVLAANQGPFFILIEIDTPGGGVDLAQRLCTAITKIDNCDTVAFISGNKFGGAFSAGATVALACNKIYMRQGTAIGAAVPYPQPASEPEETEKVSGWRVDDKFNSAWLGYCAAVAEHNNRPGLLVKAMVDKSIGVIEIVKNGEHFFIAPRNKKPKQTVVRTWSRKGSLLTLTAAEATQTGIADGVVASQADIFTELDATKARQIRDTTISKARRNFEKARRKLDKVLSTISYLENQVPAITRELENVEQQISRLRGVVYYDAYYGQYWSPYPGIDVDQWEQMLEYHDELLDELTDVSAALIRGYEKALPMAQKHPDLAYREDALQNSLESAEAIYDRVRSRPR